MGNHSVNQNRDRLVLELYEKIIEIEQRMIPTGMHVFGRASTDTEIGDLLRMVASFERPEHGTRALPDLVAEGLGLSSYTTLLEESAASEQRLSDRERVETIVRESISRFIADDKSGTESASSFLSEQAGVPAEQSQRIFAMLQSIRNQLQTNDEMKGLVRALGGQYVEPGPGADIIQNPNILPTGRNAH